MYDGGAKGLVEWYYGPVKGIGAGWARALVGGSTGGWEAAALQIFHPDAFNGAWANAPDYVDFRAFGTIDLYAEPNAYHVADGLAKVELARGDTAISAGDDRNRGTIALQIPERWQPTTV
jgi:hypothetical protein